MHGHLNVKFVQSLLIILPCERLIIKQETGRRRQMMMMTTTTTDSGITKNSEFLESTE